ncbi:MAG: TetR/AcrR family transcriptional regulator [Ruminococcaceae bacterium]|nr:TetR/AcrR family transcriptional regulator [Oscillospiraceae bacterium]
MPKIIEDLRVRLLQEAQKQITTGGYSAMTIRSVAKTCRVAVGTVYNYFSSKDELIASVMLERWKHCIQQIAHAAQSATGARSVLEAMYVQLSAYIDEYQILFRDEEAASVFAASFGKYHELLRDQLAAPLRRFCTSDFEGEFIAEALLTWTVAGEGFEEIYQVIHKIVEKE